VAKCFNVYEVELPYDESDQAGRLWADMPQGIEKKKSKRQSLKLAAMHPDKGTIYVLLFNNKILEVQQKPSPEFLLRSYGRKARVLKLRTDEVQQQPAIQNIN